MSKGSDDKKAEDGAPMDDRAAKGGDDKAEGKSKADAPPKPLSPWEALVKNVAVIERAVAESDHLLILRALRQTAYVRRLGSAAVVRRGVQDLLAESPRQHQLVSWIDAVVAAEAAVSAADVSMDGDDAGAAPEDDADEKSAETKPSDTPEVKAYLQTLVMMLLFKHGLHAECVACASDLARHGVAQNRRSLDWFTAKAYTYLSTSNEALGTLSSVRVDLTAAHRTACLRHDMVGQATLLNLLLRNYLHYDLYSQASQLLGRSTFPEEASNNQYVRYLYYRGRIQAVQLDYFGANADLTQALRKAPTNSAVGFRRTVQKLSVIVTLLLGDLPKRAIFNEKDMRAALAPYLALTQAVRTGDVGAFTAAVGEHLDVFKADRTLSLVHRLRHNVIKAGLRKIATSYSRISFPDVAAKLMLESPEDAEFLCAKAIHDGVIDATLDHENGVLETNKTVDLYSTTAPQEVFHTRIEFCLDMHNDAVKSMRYPAAKKEEKGYAEFDFDPDEVEVVVEDDDEDEEGSMM